MSDVEAENEKSKVLNWFLKKSEAKKSQFTGAIIVNIIFLYIVNNLLSWNLSFIDPSFNDVLLILNISIVANIIANILFLLYSAGWFRSLSQIVLNIIGFMVAYYLYVVFPFTFSNSLITYTLKFLLILGMVALVIATFVEVLRLVLRQLKVES